MRAAPSEPQKPVAVGEDTDGRSSPSPAPVGRAQPADSMCPTTTPSFAGLDPKSALTLLTRLAHRRPVEARQLERALSGRFRRLASLAVD
jgi:hypothetical protein